MNTSRQAREWMNRSEITLSSARILLDEQNLQPYEVVAALSHEAVALALKAALCSRGQKILRTNDLRTLIAFIHNDEIINKYRKELHFLNQFGNIVDYPVKLTVSERDAKLAFMDAAKIMKAVKNVFF